MINQSGNFNDQIPEIPNLELEKRKTTIERRGAPFNYPLTHNENAAQNPEKIDPTQIA
jgi:hypothetical protein